MPDLTAPGYWAAVADETIIRAISAGIAPEMPAFADALSEADKVVWKELARTLRGTIQ